MTRAVEPAHQIRRVPAHDRSRDPARPAGAELIAPTALLGTWQLRRRVADLRARLAGTVTGTLTLSAGADGVEWSESGVLRWTGRDVEVTRRYLLRDGADGWWVYFDDGRPFHPWTPGRVVEHPCRADLYRGLVRVDSSQRWRVGWDVRGPTKHQRIISRFVLPSGRLQEPIEQETQ